MKRGMILFSMVAMLAVSARCQTAMIALDDIPGTTLVCVTNYGPQVVSLTARVTGLEGSSNDWSKTVSNLAALSNNVSALSSRVTATNVLFSAWFAGLQSRTSYWDAAYSWGDWSVAVGANTAAIAVLQTNTVTRAGTNGFVTASITNGLASTSYVAAAVAAIPAAGAFWPPNATASSWFTFVTNSGAITITGYNIDGGTAVIIPDYIHGLPVTEIGAYAFWESGVTSIGGAGNVVTVGAYAFEFCTSLASVSLPQAQTVKNRAFGSCESLTSVSLPQVQTVGNFVFYYCLSLASVYFDNDAPTIGADTFAAITPNQVTNYVTNPQATGWGATLGGMPVVRLPLYADAIYQAGELVATEAHVAQAIAAIPEPDLSDYPTFSQIAASNALPYTAWTGTITPANGTATVSIAHGNQPVLVIDAPTVLQLDATGFGTSGVSRVSLSYYPGTNSFTFATNIIKYAETPTVDTNGWNTLLIRRVSDGEWKGVGL